MSRRVYEVAQQLGIDNKELMARLAKMGQAVKNHMAIIDDLDVKALMAPAEKSVVEPVKEIVRARPTLIHRRAKAELTPEAPPQQNSRGKVESGAVHQSRSRGCGRTESWTRNLHRYHPF